MPQPRDITGQRFGRLVAVCVAKTDTGRGRLWKCVCDCGISIRVHTESLTNGNTRSCGCLKLDMLVARSTTHGKAPRRNRHPLYTVWGGMMSRCYDELNRGYQWYGARGIGVSDEWKSFANFYADVADGYRRGLQLDRISNEGDYCKANCKWSTPSENAQNRRKPRKAA